MNTFAIAVTLSAIMGPQVFYFGPSTQFKDQAACEKVLPKAEAAVQAIVRADPDALTLFGNVTGKLTRAYFVSESDCQPTTTVEGN